MSMHVPEHIAGPVKRGVKGMIDDGGQRPRGAVSGGCPVHGAAVAEKEHVSGLEQDGVHGSAALRQVAFDEGDGLA